MKVSELGEFGLVDLIGKMVENSQDLQFNSWRQLILGIGDDAAAWYSDSSIQLAHVDSLFQDIHFRFDLTSWHDLGWKSLAVTVRLQPKDKTLTDAEIETIGQKIVAAVAKATGATLRS